MANPPDPGVSRRNFVQGSLAASAASMLGASAQAAADSLLLPTHAATRHRPIGQTADGPHFAPKARRVIYLHMEGGPSHLDLFDHKPELQQLYNTDLPDSIRNGQRLTGMTSGQKRFPVAPSIFRFDRHDNGGDGVFISELMPHLAKVANELCVIRSMHTLSLIHI